MANTSTTPVSGAGQFAFLPVIMGRRIDAVDLLVYTLILALGAIQFASQMAGDNYWNYPYHSEIVRSILSHGFYGFDGRYETLYPPGPAYLFALIAVVFGLSRFVLARSMAVFLTLGLMAGYNLLKREAGRTLAAAACLLLASSPDLFAFSTQAIGGELPYLAVTMVCFILGRKLDAAQRLRRRIVLGSLFSLSLALALMLRAAAIAVLAALAGWLVASFLQDAKRARLRLLLFLPGLLLGVAIQGAWMRWADTHNQPEWPIPGWPGSYFSQLTLKSGNNPDLGKATLADIPGRIERNLLDHSEWLARFLFHKKWKPEWYSPGAAATTLLILLGLARSFWRMRADLVDWYFVGYEAMLLLWPWDIEPRFLIAIAPLAGLYLWRGGELLLRADLSRPLLTAGITAAVALAWALAAGPRHADDFVFWLLFAGLSSLIVAVALLKRTTLARAASFASQTILSVKRRRLSVAQTVLVIFVAAVFGTGIAGQVAIARANLHFDETKQGLYADVEAARWIQAHTAESDVVMARKFEMVYHFCHRRVVWFPPTSNADMLMEGIRKHHIAWIIVMAEGNIYYRPTEEDSFESLARKYPGQFQLAQEGPHYRIYSVTGQK